MNGGQSVIIAGRVRRSLYLEIKTEARSPVIKQMLHEWSEVMTSQDRAEFLQQKISKFRKTHVNEIIFFDE